MIQPSSNQSRRLPDNWVQRIFATMQGNYGSRFLNMWKTGQILPDGNDAGIVNAMNHWAEKLGGWHDSPDTIRQVLENLPTEPPTLPQFVQMLRQSYRPPPMQAIERKWTQAELDQNRQRICEIFATLNLKAKK